MSRSFNKIGIRVDGSHTMGLGHIYRTLWLARALRREGREVEFFVTEDLTVKDLLRANGFATRWFSNNLEEFEKTKVLNLWAFENRPAALIIDHYQWTQECWESLKIPEGIVLAAVNLPREGFSKFHLAFQGIYDSLSFEEFVEEGCSIYGGVRYLMISPEHVKLAGGWVPPKGRLETILLAFGGTDVADFSSKTLDRLEKIKECFKLTLIMGPGSKNFETIYGRVNRFPHQLEVFEGVEDLPARMSRSHLAITTAGMGTLSELALTGTPAIVLAAAEHQVKNAKKFAAFGGVINCAFSPGEVPHCFEDHLKALTFKPERLKEMFHCWSGLVDGRGIERIVNIILERTNRGN